MESVVNNRKSLLPLFYFTLVVTLSNSRSDGVNYGDLFSTKTSYESSFGGRDKMRAVLENTRNHIEKTKESCIPLQLNALIRHGTRYPSKIFCGNVSRLIEIQEHMQSEEYLYLKDQIHPFLDVMQSKMLADNGKNELFNLGVRFTEYFPELFLNNSQNVTERRVFISSNLSRCVDSAISFIQGMRSILGDTAEESVDEIEILNNTMDVVLRFFDNCEKFVKTVEKNETALADYYLFGDGPEVGDVVNRIVDKLKINKLKVNNEHARTLYAICSNSLAIHNESSWCDVFTLEDLRVMEYWADLKHYWRKSYGHEINYHISCKLLQHVFSTLEDAIMDYNNLSNPDVYPVGVFRFGHAETLLPFLSILGLYKDEENILKFDNYLSNRNRTFRASKMSPFAGNVAFVLYSCNDENDDHSTYMVEVFVHEQPVILPCCSSTLCPYHLVKDHYSRWIDDCNFTKICRTWLETRLPKNEL